MEGVGIERQGDINRKIMIYYVSQRVRGWVRRWLILRKSICLIPSLLKQGRICMGTRKVLSLQPRLMKETWQMTLSQKVSSPSHWVSGHLDALHKNGWYCIYPTLHFWMEQEMATHSSVLAWRIPGTGEPDGLPSMGSHRVRHEWNDLAAAAAAADLALHIHRLCIHGFNQLWNLWMQRTHCTESLYIRDLSIHRFWYPQGSWNQYPADIKGLPYSDYT